MDSFQGKTILITGATSGIGLALAKALSNDAAHLILCGRNLKMLKQFTDNKTWKAKITTLHFDLSNPESVNAGLLQLGSEINAIDVIIHSGGLSQRASVMDTSEETLRYVMEVNFFSTVTITKAVIPGMLEKGSGNVIIVSSVTGKVGIPLRSAYAASKHALHGFYDSMRAELHDKGVVFTLLCPGYINTHISVNAIKGDGTLYNKLDNNQKKGMDPDRFARIALRKIQQGKSEIYIGGKEIIGIYLKRFFPGLLRKIVLNQLPS